MRSDAYVRLDDENSAQAISLVHTHSRFLACGAARGVCECDALLPLYCEARRLDRLGFAFGYAARQVLSPLFDDARSSFHLSSKVFPTS
eukprot:2408950-Prymnesium_polylepis.1